MSRSTHSCSFFHHQMYIHGDSRKQLTLKLTLERIGSTSISMTPEIMPVLVGIKVACHGEEDQAEQVCLSDGELSLTR